MRRATEPPGPGAPAEDEDGQATALRDAAALVFAADCLPIVLAADGAVAALHGGWRGLAGGIVAEGVRALRELGGDGPVRRRDRPGRPRCCYEVGEDRYEHFAHVPDARVGERNLDLPAVARHDLAEAGVAEVHDLGLCTMCRPDLFFSHRADGGVTGRQAGVVARLITGLDAARVRENAERIRSEIGDAELLAAVKYVPLEELEVLAEAGVTLLGENRAQDLAAKAEAYPRRLPLALHRPAPEPQGQGPPAARGAHPLRRLGLRAAPARSSTGRRRPRCSSRSTSRGRRARPASPRPSSAPSSSAARSTVAGLMTMPPFTEDPEASRPHFAALRELAREHGLRHLSMGTSQDYRVAAEEGATIVRVGSTLYA